MLGVLIIGLALQGCAQQRPVNQNAFLALREAGYAYAHDGKHAEAYAIAVLLEDANQHDPKVPALKSAALKKDPDLRGLESRKWLGGNHSMRPEKFPTPVLSTILLYPFNILNDIVDLASIEIGAGVGLGVKAKATEIAALGIQAEAGEALIGWRGGAPTAYHTAENSIDLLALEFREGLYPTDRMYHGAKIASAQDGLKVPGSPPYDFATDYYGVGAHVMAGLVVVNVEFHPVQLLDAVAGLLFFDPMNDNFAVNETIRLSDEDLEHARNLYN
jgi:hypothetical protein